MANIKDVASFAGVSISTVSHVLNETKYVSTPLREKVMHAVQVMGYEADPVARNMKSGKTRNIGVISADVCGLFYPYIVKGIYELANQKDYSVTLFDANTIYDRNNVYQKEQACFDRLISNRVDGIIFASSVEESQMEQFVREIKKKAEKYKKTAFVSVERDFSRYGVDSVFSDNVAGANKAVSHLLDCGCINICHITGPVKAQVAQERVKGYLRTMERHGHTVDPERMIANGDYTHQSGYLAMEELLSKNPTLDGVFISNDQMAIGALKALKERKIRIPETVKVIGFDDVFISSIVDPPLSTIHILKRHMGLMATEMLLKQMENGDRETAVCRELETSLVVRQSTVADALETWELSDW